MFSSIAHAEETAQAIPALAGESTLMNFVPIVLIFIIFYFLLIRPQMKKQKEQQALINSVKKGDKIFFAGGLVGTFLKEEENGVVEIELTKDTRVKALKSTIISIVNNNAAPATQKAVVDTAAPAIEAKKTKKTKK